MNFLHDIYRLAYIKRYSNVPKLHEESVAEHGFFVAAITMKLREEYVFNLGVALGIAVSHDIPEMELNDCPYIIKEKYPEIKKAFDICERDVASKLPQHVQWGVQAFDKGTSIEAIVVKLADAMQVEQFTKVEVELGNKGYMEKVYCNAQRRITEIRKELEHVKVEQSN